MTALLRIAARNVTRNRRRSLITLAAIFVGVGAMLVSRGMLNAVQGAIREEIILGQVGAIVVHRAGFMKSLLGAPLSFDVPADPHLLSRIRSVPGVRAVAARIVFGGMVNAGDTTVFALVSGLDPEAEYQVCPRKLKLVASGKPLASSDKDGGLVSGELARRLGLRLGARAAILAPDREGVLNGVDVSLAGTLGLSAAPGMESKIVSLPLALAQELLRMPGRATEIAVGVDDLAHLEETRAAVAAALGAEFEVHTWHDVAPFVDDVVAIQNAVLSVISAVILFVALLGIANTMLMSVLERTREIGTMMAVGVRRRKILALFLQEAALLALVGGALAAAAGLAIIRSLSRDGIHFAGPGGGMLDLYPSLSLGYTLGMIVLGCAGAVLAALYPAWKAARLRPVEALSHL